MGLLSSLVVAAMIPPMVSGFKAAMARQARPAVVEAPAYQSLIGDELRGSGFHFDYNGNLYIACSQHQFGYEAPTSMISDLLGDNTTNVPVDSVVHTQADLQVVTYDVEALADVEPLTYDPTVVVDPGHPIFVLCEDEPIVANVTIATPDSEGLVWARLDDPTIDLAGCSGAAVVSGETGTVVGVLMASGFFGMGFELLELPEELAGDQ